MYNRILSQNPIISDQIEAPELTVILRELEKIVLKNIEGEIVEFGCYSGTTSLFLSRLLKEANSTKRLYVYDSFDGLPDKTKEDESPLGTEFKRGELRSTKNKLIENYRKAGLSLPIIKKAWFHEIEEDEVPDKICFAFLDGDYYKSIRISLSLIAHKLSPGATIVIDDYDNPKLPGVKKAVSDFGMDKYTIRTEESLALISV